MRIRRNNRFFLHFILIVLVGQLGLGYLIQGVAAGELIPFLLALGLGVFLIRRKGRSSSACCPIMRASDRSPRCLPSCSCSRSHR